MKKLNLKIFAAAALIFCLISSAAYPLDENDMPDTATLSANRMRFDAQTGDFLADGEVRIQAGDLNVEAPIGTGNIDRREVNFDEGITASGKWQGSKIDLRAGNLALTFNDIPTCRFRNGVKGGYGSMKIDSDALTIIGAGGIQAPTAADNKTKFTIVGARNLEDTSQGLSFSASNVEGLLMNGELQEMTADKKISIKGRPKGKGEPVSLRGDKAVYSLERESVVVSGHVVAVQGGRTLRSDAVVYFPKQNRVEALGGLTRESNGVVSADRAEITIDLKRENTSGFSKPKTTPNPEPKVKEKNGSSKKQEIKIKTNSRQKTK